MNYLFGWAAVGLTALSFVVMVVRLFVPRESRRIGQGAVIVLQHFIFMMVLGAVATAAHAETVRDQAPPVASMYRVADHGLGLTLADAQHEIKTLAGVTLESSPLADGTPRWMGQKGFLIAEATGPADDLDSVTWEFTLPQNITEHNAAILGAASMAWLHWAAPDWPIDDMKAWFATLTSTLENNQVVVGDRRIKGVVYSNMRMVLLKVEANS